MQVSKAKNTMVVMSVMCSVRCVGAGMSSDVGVV